nr:hypothetical protein [Tanacetum cinerariifolium]
MHGLPPTKRLFRVTQLDPILKFIGPWRRFVDPGQPSVGILGNGEWSSPAGLKLAQENLQSRVKEEDSITNFENAVFDLRVMDPLCFLFIDQRVLIGLVTKFI